jgi:DNA-binding response OmpR family regulator
MPRLLALSLETLSPTYEAARASLKGPGVDPTPAGRRILLAEDDIATAFEFEAALREAGFDVIGPALQARDAIEMIDTHRVDAAVIDFGLAQSSMHEVFWPLVASRTPFIVLTGYEQPTLPSWLPGSDLCLKPCAPQELVERLNRLLEQSPARPSVS